MARAAQLNPARTAAFATKMARLPPEHQADVALKWRERAIELVHANADPIHTSLGTGVAVLYAGGIGAWDGANEAKRDALVATWRGQTAPAMGVDPNAVREPFQDVYDAQGNLVHKAVKDPRKFFRMNKTLYPTLLLLLGGTTAAAYGSQAYRYMVFPALAGLGYSGGSLSRDWAYRRQLQRQAGGATQTGGEGNPYAGYPQAI